MKRAFITAPAEDDLAALWSWIAQHNPNVADRVIHRLRNTCGLLAGRPGIGRPRDELRPGYRSYHVGSVLIIYQPIDDGIAVIRVVSGFRDLPRLFADA